MNRITIKIVLLSITIFANSLECAKGPKPSSERLKKGTTIEFDNEGFRSITTTATPLKKREIVEFEVGKSAPVQPTAFRASTMEKATSIYDLPVNYSERLTQPKNALKVYNMYYDALQEYASELRAIVREQSNITEYRALAELSNLLPNNPKIGALLKIRRQFDDKDFLKALMSNKNFEKINWKEIIKESPYQEIPVFETRTAVQPQKVQPVSIPSTPRRLELQGEEEEWSALPPEAITGSRYEERPEQPGTPSQSYIQLISTQEKSGTRRSTTTRLLEEQKITQEMERQIPGVQTAFIKIEHRPPTTMGEKITAAKTLEDLDANELKSLKETSPEIITKLNTLYNQALQEVKIELQTLLNRAKLQQGPEATGSSILSKLFEITPLDSPKLSLINKLMIMENIIAKDQPYTVLEKRLVAAESPYGSITEAFKQTQQSPQMSQLKSDAAKAVDRANNFYDIGIEKYWINPHDLAETPDTAIKFNNLYNEALKEYKDKLLAIIKDLKAQGKTLHDYNIIALLLSDYLIGTPEYEKISKLHNASLAISNAVITNTLNNNGVTVPKTFQERLESIK